MYTLQVQRLQVQRLRVQDYFPPGRMTDRLNFGAFELRVWTPRDTRDNGVTVTRLRGSELDVSAGAVLDRVDSSFRRVDKPNGAFSFRQV